MNGGDLCRWDNTAPTLAFMMNWRSGSRLRKMGAVEKASFSCWNEAVASGAHNRDLGILQSSEVSEPYKLLQWSDTGWKNTIS